MTANIRIINNIAQNAILPYFLTLIPLDVLDPEGDTIVFPYNPESYTESINPNWSGDDLAGAERQSASWSGNSNKRLQFRIQLTPGVTGILQRSGGVRRNFLAESVVETLCARLENLASIPTERTQEPTRFDVIAGERFFVGHIASLNVKRTQTNERGHAIEAEVSITFEENQRN
jgi:hypothetical protein